MRAADEVTLVYAMNGADRDTGAAAGTLRVIYRSEIVNDVDSVVRTGLFALLAGDTAVGAILPRHSSGVVTGALDDDSRGVVDKVEESVRTGSGADAAADALSRVNPGNSVLNSYSVGRAGVDTVAVAKAGVHTASVAVVGDVCGAAGLLSDVVKLLLDNVTLSVAGNVGNLLDNVLRLDAHSVGDSLSGAVAAGNTEVSTCFSALRESLRVAVTARVATGSAVSAGKTVADSNRALVLLDSEEDRGNGEKHGGYNADS